MDTRYPHEIVEDIRSVPKRERRHYRPIQPAKVDALRAMSPEQRAEWLAAHPLDALRIVRAEEKRQSKRERRSREAEIRP